MVRFIAFSMLCVLLSVPAAAHDPGLSTAEVRVESRRVVATLTLASSDARVLTEGGSTAPNLVELRLGDRLLTAEVGDVRRQGRVQEDELQVSLRWQLPEASAAGVFQLQLPFLQRLSRGHRVFLSVIGADGAPVLEQVLSARSAPVRF